VGGWEFNHSHTRLIVATLLKIKINIHKKLTIELVETKFPEILLKRLLVQFQVTSLQIDRGMTSEIDN
jgi:hypothetical protein